MNTRYFRASPLSVSFVSLWLIFRSTLQFLNGVISLHESYQNERQYDQDDRDDDQKLDERNAVTFAWLHGEIWTAGGRNGLVSRFCRGAGSHGCKELRKLRIFRIVSERIL